MGQNIHPLKCLLDRLEVCLLGSRKLESFPKLLAIVMVDLTDKPNKRRSCGHTKFQLESKQKNSEQSLKFRVRASRRLSADGLTWMPLKGNVRQTNLIFNRTIPIGTFAYYLRRLRKLFWGGLAKGSQKERLASEDLQGTDRCRGDCTVELSWTVQLAAAMLIGWRMRFGQVKCICKCLLSVWAELQVTWPHG